MPFQPWEDGCVEVVFRFTLFGIPLVVVIAICLDSGAVPTPGQVDSIASVADQWMEFDIMPLLSEDLQFTETQATDKHAATAYQKVISHGGGIAGGVAQHSIPSQLAFVVTLYTALRGRSYRGRTFLPGVPLTYLDTGTDSNNVTLLNVALLLTAYNGIDARLGTIACHQDVISRVSGGVPRPIALGQRVTTRAADQNIDTLRRRGANAHRS